MFFFTKLGGIAWSPFVGMFIARASKGRSVREFVTAVLIVPVLLSFMWMSTFGTTAICQDSVINGQLLEAVNTDTLTTLFATIHGMEGTIEVILLLAGGSNDLSALQTGVTISGLPFTIIFLAMMYSLHVGLRNDLKKLKEYKEDKLVITLFNEKVKGSFENDGRIKFRLNK